MKTARISLIIVTLLLFSFACAQAQSEAEMNELGSALTKLSSAVESTVHYKKQGADLPDDKLLILSTQHDLGLLDRFLGCKLRVLRQSSHSAVLACTPDGRNALLEDAGCTARMDQLNGRPGPCSPANSPWTSPRSVPAPNSSGTPPLIAVNRDWLTEGFARLQQARYLERCRTITPTANLQNNLLTIRAAL